MRLLIPEWFCSFSRCWYGLLTQRRRQAVEISSISKEFDMSKGLSDKVALVTGGSRGLGAATAAALADNGADVAISYVASDQKAAAVIDGLKAKGVRAVAIKADQGDPSASEPLIREVVEQFGKLDILVNNAA